MRINDAGLALLKEFEGLSLKVYLDIVGNATVGYGHMDPSLKVGDTITQEQADEYLRQDLAHFEAGVTSLVKVPVNENEFSALVCFAYNVGLGNLKSSLLLRCLNNHNRQNAADQFPRWDRAHSIEVAGLKRRRLAERALFLTS